MMKFSRSLLTVAVATAFHGVSLAQVGTMPNDFAKPVAQPSASVQPPPPAGLLTGGVIPKAGKTEAEPASALKVPEGGAAASETTFEPVGGKVGKVGGAVSATPSPSVVPLAGGSVVVGSDVAVPAKKKPRSKVVPKEAGATAGVPPPEVTTRVIGPVPGGSLAESAGGANMVPDMAMPTEPALPGFGPDNSGGLIELPATKGGRPVIEEPKPTGMAAVIKRMQDEAASGKPAYIQAKQGVTEIVPISRTQLNRIVTTFEKPNGVTIAQGTKVMIQGRSIFVASSSEEPVGLFITDESEPDKAISLTLIPSDIPPREIFITLLPSREMAGFNAMTAAPAQSNDESSGDPQSFIDQVKILMRELAVGKLPGGFSLSDHTADVTTLRCPQKGFSTTLGQMLEGPHNQRIAVFLAKNMSSKNSMIDEQSCYRKGVKAVAAWPKVVVEPGKATEIYVFLERKNEEVDTYTARPSLLRGQ